MSDSPQTEDGFTRIANELLEAIIHNDFSKREMKIIWAVIRKTYGWQQKFDRIALSQFEELTGLKKNHISTTLAALMDKKVVLKRDYKYSLNKRYFEWEGNKYSPEIGLKKSPETGLKQEQSQNGTSPETGLQNSPETGPTQSQNRTKTSPKTGLHKRKKETLQKKLKKHKGKIPDWIDLELWEGFIEIRAAQKATNSDLAIKTIFGKLERWKSEGHDPNEIIKNSVVNSWKGVFKPKTKPQQNRHSFDEVDYTYGVSADGKF
ncbi:MAG: replication protein [Pseudomonadales bacterium]|nr:replication protein [Pseudomonadales bacterium]